MILSNQQKAKMEKAMQNLATIRKGDFVKVVNCWEAELYGDKIFEVTTEPRQIGGTWCVGITGNGQFDISCLEKVLDKADADTEAELPSDSELAGEQYWADQGGDVE